MLVVDTCVLVDIADDDPTHGLASAQCLADHLDGGLVISPVSYVELGPVFDGSIQLLDEFLDGVGVGRGGAFTAEDRVTAFRAWARHITEKRARRARRRPVADALIGALAVRHEGIITRNGKDFRSFYPKLCVVDPADGVGGE
jgi:predicted nucleic acid-binding protein